MKIHKNLQKSVVRINSTNVKYIDQWLHIRLNQDIHKHFRKKRNSEVYRIWYARKREELRESYKEEFGVYPTDKTSQFEKGWRLSIRKEFPNYKTVYNPRPPFLMNKETGRPLELDILFDEHNVAVEVNGEQHYKFVSRFHNGVVDFLSQQKRDKLKQKLCRESKVTLISIAPWDKRCEKLEEIRKALEK